MKHARPPMTQGQGAPLRSFTDHDDVDHQTIARIAAEKNPPPPEGPIAVVLLRASVVKVDHEALPEDVIRDALESLGISIEVLSVTAARTTTEP